MRPVDWRGATVAASAVVTGASRGSGVLVDRGRLLTAAHLLRRPREGEGSDAVAVEFPDRRLGVRLAARVLPIEFCVDDLEIDVAVLELLEQPAWLPEPIALWPGRRTPAQLEIFGFPTSERQLRGVWRGFQSAGPVAGTSAVQLRWREDAGALPGHSGAPVLDAQTGMMSGVLVEGSIQGRFDRFVPIHEVQARWPSLPRPWLMTGGEGRRHFASRARGRRADAGEDLFQGRDAALGLAQAWMTGERASRTPLVITGQPGAGKSAVVSRSALALEATGRWHGLAFHARDAVVDELLDALGILVGTAAGADRRAVLDGLASDGPVRPWLIVIDALDELAAGVGELVRFVREIAGLATVRVMVGTRRHEPRELGEGEPSVGLIAELTPHLHSVVDLDDDRYFEIGMLGRYVEELLAVRGPSGGAWEVYRAEPGLRRRLARVVADRANRNFLVATIAADRLHEQREPVDVEAEDFDATTIPSTVGDALERYIASVPEARQSQRRGVLVALALAREALDDRLWLDIARALGYSQSTQSDLDDLRDTSAADYLIHSFRSDIGGRRVTRLFHQALADQLLARRDLPSDNDAVVSLLMPFASGAGAALTVAYTRDHLGEHAAACGRLPEILRDASYLRRADLSRLLPVLRRREVRGDPAAAVVRRAASRALAEGPEVRARLFALAAAQLGEDELRGLHSRFEHRVRSRWALGRGTSHEDLTGHSGAIEAIVIGQLAGGRDVLVSGGLDDTVRVWDLSNGRTYRVLSGHRYFVMDVDIGRLADGRDVVVSASYDGTARVWDIDSGEVIQVLEGHRAIKAKRFAKKARDPRSSTARWLGHDHGAEVTAVALGRLEGEQDVLATAGLDGTMQLWDPLTGRQLRVLAGSGRFGAVAFGWPFGRPDLLVSAEYGAVRVWDAQTGRLERELLGHTSQLTELALGLLPDGRGLIATAGQDRTIRLWDAATGAELAVLRGHDDWVRALALGRLRDGRYVLASGDESSTLCLWDLQNIGRKVVLTGHLGGAEALAFGRLTGQVDVLAASARERIELWDPSDDAVTAPSPTINDVLKVRNLAVGRAPGDRLVLVTAGLGDLVHLRDPESGEINSRLGAGKRVKTLDAAVSADGRLLIAAGIQKSDVVSVWDAITGQVLALLGGDAATVVHAIAFGRASGGSLVLACKESKNHTVLIRDPDTGELLQTLPAHTWGACLAFGRDPDGRAVLAEAGHAPPPPGSTCTVRDPDEVAHERVATRTLLGGADPDDTVRLWDPENGRPLGTLTGYRRTVFAASFVPVPGAHDILATGGPDGSLLLWDVAARRLRASMPGHPGGIYKLTTGHLLGGRAVLVSAGLDETIRLWDVGATALIEEVRVFGSVHAIALDEGQLFVASTAGLHCFHVDLL